MQGRWHTAHICNMLPLCSFLPTNSNLTDLNFAPGPALHCPPFHKHRGRLVVSPPPPALKWSESRELSGQRGKTISKKDIPAQPSPDAELPHQENEGLRGCPLSPHPHPHPHHYFCFSDK